ncbi:MAG: hypothetical protein ABR598_01220 [Candidatus Dormibacteria bacterium]
MVHQHDLLGCVGAQFLGAGLGALLSLAAWGPRLRQVGFGATVPHAAVSVAAAATTRILLRRAPRTAKLFHDPTFRSVFKAALPGTVLRSSRAMRGAGRGV